MPRIESWSRLPLALRDHLVERMRDRNIGVEDLNKLRLWIEGRPEVPEGPWYKDFGSFKLCGEGKYPKISLPIRLHLDVDCRVLIGIFYPTHELNGIG